MQTGNALEAAWEDSGIELSEEQKRAVEACLAGNVTIITGGPGTGKTTIINTLVRIFGFAGMEVALAAPTGRAAKRLSEATGMDAKTIRVRADELLVTVGLADAASRPLKSYSKGMLQRAGIAQALLHDPDLLVLDEPFTGLDPLARIHFRDLMRTLREQGKSIFFSSHELGETELLCDTVAIMKKGKAVYQGPVRQLAGDGERNLERLFLEVLEKGETA